MLPGRCVFLGGDRSYGDDAVLYVSEEHARLLLGARKIKLIDPPGLPAELVPVPMNGYGTAAIGNIGRGNSGIRA